MTVNILVSIPNRDLFRSCTLVFDTIRVGFPTATLRVMINANTHPEDVIKVQKLVASCGGFCAVREEIIHHATWIRSILRHHECESGPCIILDADMIFWESCEHWSFDTSLAGYYVPMIYNDFAQCISFERLHTSFLWVENADHLFYELETAYPQADAAAGEYCPVDPFMPRVQFIKGSPFFWDSTAALYNMVGGTAFSERHIAAYEHLNSASFFDVMRERLENKTGFDILHKQLVHTPEALRGWNQMVGQYYAQKHQEAKTLLQTLTPTRLQSFKLLFG